MDWEQFRLQFQKLDLNKLKPPVPPPQKPRTDPDSEPDDLESELLQEGDRVAFTCGVDVKFDNFVETADDAAFSPTQLVVNSGDYSTPAPTPRLCLSSPACAEPQPVFPSWATNTGDFCTPTPTPRGNVA
eukprot:TRINITY_DN1359_c0_g1_i1.p1 TRINITY_DN1359_c0_g1~~TRINITY_DN1359_c0_g1_i1.p1  ORF type:complete len:130 (+),score=20.17 TRINITY_DN1359_c0_g1_i1:54-443(+)